MTTPRTIPSARRLACATFLVGATLVLPTRVTATETTGHDHGLEACTCADPSLAAHRVRKNVKDLNATEKKEFVDALLQLKQVPSPWDPTLSYYDQFVQWHITLYRCDFMMPGHPMQLGHGGPVFLPWHRVFVLLLENALRQVSGRPISVPYWDWTDPESTAAAFSDDLMGGDGDPNDGFAVNSGPFRKGQWDLNVHPEGMLWQPSRTTHLTRRFGTMSVLPTPAEVEYALDRPFYDVEPYNTASNPDLSFRAYIEGFRDYPGPSSMVCLPDGTMMINAAVSNYTHNAVHGWVGGLIGATPDGVFPVFGTMVLPTSPNDPVFFLNHSNLDRIWAEWQERHGIDTYQPASGVMHNSADDVMHPYDAYGIQVTPRQVQSIKALRYHYH